MLRRFKELPLADRVVFALTPFLVAGGYLGTSWLRPFGVFGVSIALAILLALFAWLYFRWWRRQPGDLTELESAGASREAPEAEPRHRESGRPHIKLVPPGRPWIAPVIAIGLSVLVLVISALYGTYASS
jgi:hypothetical protein